MKLTTIFLIASIVHVSAASMAQQITLKRSNLSYKQLFKEVRKQTGYSIIWESDKFNANEKISVNFRKTDLREVFDEIFLSRGYFYLVDETTVIIENRSSYNQNDKSPKGKANNIDATGKVVDENGQPIGGASVLVKATGKGVSTKADGTFILLNIEDGELLVIKFLGYDYKEIRAGRNLGLVRLVPATNQLDQVQIQAYTQTSKRLSTANITSVKAEEIEKQPINNPLLALQGRVPGLEITQMSGAAGATVKVKIQGTNSLRGGTDPFYVVDGVPFTASMLTTGQNTAAWGSPDRAIGLPGFNSNNLSNPGAGSPFSYLNTWDIESIEILKDADATAIYGSRAANGAIIITTKKGKMGPLSVNLNLRNGWDKVVRRMEVANTEEYLRIKNEGIKNYPPSANALLQAYATNGLWDSKSYTDWQEELLGKSVNNSNGQLDISGGTAVSSYRMGVGFNRQTAIFSQGNSNRSISLSASLNTASTNQRFKLQLSANYLANKNRLPAININEYVLTRDPNAPPLTKEDGSINWGVKDAFGISSNALYNPLAQLANYFEASGSNLGTNITLSYNLLNGFDVRISTGYNLMNSNLLTTSTLAQFAPELRVNNTRSGIFGINSTSSFLVEPQTTFRKQIGNHKFNFLLGGTIQQNNANGKQLMVMGQPSDNQIANLQSGTPNGLAQVSNQYKYNAIFARSEYNYGDKYLLNLTVRTDASSRFGPDNSAHSFWSVGAGWIFSETKWFRNYLRILSFGKIKASYGTTGNDQIGDYTFMDLYTAVNAGIPYHGFSSLTPTELTNPKLQWELTKKMNVGVDLSFFTNRINLSMNYAMNRSSNLLQQVTLPMLTGFNNVYINFPGIVQNLSTEIVLTTVNVKTKKFVWNSSINVTLPRNKLVSFPAYSELLDPTTQGLIVGQPLNSFYVWQFSGVDPLTGRFVAEDANGNPTHNPVNFPVAIGGDQKILNNMYSPFFGGMQHSFSFGNISASFSFTFRKQKIARYLWNAQYPGTGGVNNNFPSAFLNIKRWENPGDIALVQKASFSPFPVTSFTGSNAYYVDGSYARLQNVALSWALSEKIAKRIHMKNCKILLQGQNVWTLTGYTGIDPESGPTALPPVRTIILGLQAGF